MISYFINIYDSRFSQRAVGGRWLSFLPHNEIIALFRAMKEEMMAFPHVVFVAAEFSAQCY
jgi:hypothetical protein